VIRAALLAIVLTLVPAARAEPEGPDPEVTSPELLGEVTRYLYRWHLDEHDVRPEVNRGEFVFWVTELRPALDAGDESRFAWITLPRVGVRALAKKADYAIPELGLVVRNETYLITRVEELPPTDGPAPEGASVVELDYEEMRDHLFRTRALLRPPTDELLERMRVAARDRTRRFLEHRGDPPPTTPQTIHLAPISPVASEAWLYWEDERVLYRFSADLDLNDPAMWDHVELGVELFDLDEQVVVSLDEVAGSNAYVTRDMVGRALYNCVVLGRRVELVPEIAEETAD
jgi:hypothetical protein